VAMLKGSRGNIVLDRAFSSGLPGSEPTGTAREVVVNSPSTAGTRCGGGRLISRPGPDVRRRTAGRFRGAPGHLSSWPCATRVPASPRVQRHLRAFFTRRPRQGDGSGSRRSTGSSSSGGFISWRGRRRRTCVQSSSRGRGASGMSRGSGEMVPRAARRSSSWKTRTRARDGSLCARELRYEVLEARGGRGLELLGASGRSICSSRRDHPEVTGVAWPTRCVRSGAPQVCSSADTRMPSSTGACWRRRAPSCRTIHS